MGKTYQSIVINAPVEKVWSAVRNFHDASWAPNVLESCDVVGNLAGDQIGAKRVLNGAFHETLQELSDLDRRIRYTIDNGPSPVSADDVQGYVGVLELAPVTEGGGTFVQWHSSWDGAEEACDFCHNIYVALLGDMKNSCEG
jgi:hypothetical protein